MFYLLGVQTGCLVESIALVTAQFYGNLGISVAYIILALLIRHLVGKDGVPYKKLWYGFSAFIFFCGLSHILHAFALFYPKLLWPDAVVTNLTALFSLSVAIGGILFLPDMKGVLYWRELKDYKFEEIGSLQSETGYLARINTQRVNTCLARNLRGDYAAPR